MTMPAPGPMRAVQRATLRAIAWTASQAPLAANRPTAGGSGPSRASGPGSRSRPRRGLGGGAQGLGAGRRAQRVRVVGAVPTRQGAHGRAQGLVAGVRPAGLLAQAEPAPDDLPEAQMPGQGGRQQEPGIGRQSRVVERRVEPVEGVRRSDRTGAPLPGPAGCIATPASQLRRPPVPLSWTADQPERPVDPGLETPGAVWIDQRAVMAEPWWRRLAPPSWPIGPCPMEPRHVPLQFCDDEALVRGGCHRLHRCSRGRRPRPGSDEGSGPSACAPCLRGVLAAQWELRPHPRTR